MRYFIISLLIALFALHSASAAEYWASPTGLATNSGSAVSPWDLAKAGNAPVAGDTVHITAGIYNQRLIIATSGSATGGMITYLGSAGAIIDGTALAIPTGDFVGLVHIDGQRYVRVEGLEIRNWKTSSSSTTPVGIFVQSAAGVVTDIQLVGNHIHDIWQRSAGAGAHGIGVYGNNATAISRLLIQGNELDHCQLGWSETMAINGNVDGFEVSDNNIHDDNNIGIDCIGYEGTAPSGSTDYARNGLVARNTVHNIHTNGYDASSANPAYATNDDSSDGIYVDGASDTVIERNLVYDCDIGIEIGAEHAGGLKNSVNCTIRDNIVHTTIQGCLNLGGYAANLSWAENCLVAHNTCFNADIKGQGYGLVVLQKSRNCTFRNNIFMAQSGAFAISATQNAANVTGHDFDWNIYWKVGGTPAFQLASGSSSTGLPAFREATGQDANSLQADPLLISIAAPLDFRLQSNSPAINGGDPAFAIGSGETDFSGAVRIQGGRTDVGSYESGSAAAPTVVTPANGPSAPVTGTSTSLHVLGGPAGNAASLIYSWSVVAAPSGGVAVFAPNGTNVARDTTVTFDRIGTWQVHVTIADPANGTATISGPVTITVAATFTSVAISGPATVAADATARFAALGRDQFAQALAAQPAFVWTATVGVIDATGMFTAGSVASTALVTASSGVMSGQATISIIATGDGGGGGSASTGGSDGGGGHSCGLGAGAALVTMSLLFGGWRRRRTPE